MIEKEVTSYQLQPLDHFLMTEIDNESQDSHHASVSAAASVPVASSSSPNGKGFFASAESPSKVSFSQQPTQVSPR